MEKGRKGRQDNSKNGWLWFGSVEERRGHGRVHSATCSSSGGLVGIRLVNHDYTLCVLSFFYHFSLPSLFSPYSILAYPSIFTRRSVVVDTLVGCHRGSTERTFVDANININVNDGDDENDDDQKCWSTSLLINILFIASRKQIQVLNVVNNCSRHSAFHIQRTTRASIWQ